MQIRERPSISPSTSVYDLDSYSVITLNSSQPLGDQPIERLHFAQRLPVVGSWSRKLKKKVGSMEWNSVIVGVLPSFRSILIATILSLFLIVTLRPIYRYFEISPFTDPDCTTFHDLPQYEGPRKLDTETKMLIVVISAADDSTQRHLIRNDWAQQSKRKNTTRVVFVVGLSHGNKTDLKTEQLLFKDLVLTSVVENYYNLSLKTLASLLFARSHHPHAKCVVKVDSDNVVNVSNFEDLCDSFDEDDELIVGHCEDQTPVIRDWTSKWRIPRFVYAHDKYPLYCFGETYALVGRRVPDKLLDQLDDHGFFRSENARKMPEDLIFSGFLAAKAGIERRNVDGFALQRLDAQFGCLSDRVRAYSYHLIEEKRNFAKAHLLMNQTNRTACADE